MINNNLVRSHNEDGIEVLVIGCGLGFKKKSGDVIETSLIEKIYMIQDKKTSNQLIELLSSIPNEHIQTANAIVSYAKEALDCKINDSIYISLTDHLSYAIQRYEEGIHFKNALLWEIKKYYNKEYKVGLEALNIIEARLKIRLTEDEAGYIALHLVGASLKVGNVVESTDMLGMIQNILQIVKYQLNIEFDEESIHYERFLTHLKFFAQRVINNKELEDDNEALIKTIKKEYEREYKCATKIRAYIKLNYAKVLTDTELIYLTVHIKRIAMN
ncbi:BglG family transcription antiterminator LicT [Fusibacter sp. 3D3]|uniref:BglG family transcription antiterminator LicT n=1 Tax=Fusibacter sp. 3D3 TaxID=1048380 RepID=UPI001FA76C78|nr:PRD domain-containing protein [Fusibacter sp. 3D3]